MLFKEFILRFVGLEAGLVFLSDIQPNKLVFRWTDDAQRCVYDLKDLLNTLVDRKDGYYSVKLDMAGGCLEFEFHEGGI